MGSFVWPVSTAAIITSPFGPRWGSFHYGTDLSYGGCNGDIIKAARAGKVTFAGSSGTYGNLVKISHGGGVETRYAHCSSFIVSAGDQLGLMGASGNVTGAHVHVEVFRLGTMSIESYASSWNGDLAFGAGWGSSALSRICSNSGTPCRIRPESVFS